MSKRIKTKYPGIFYRDAKRVGGRGTEKIFYAVFKKKVGDKSIVFEEKCGRQYSDDMTAAKASIMRGEFIEGARDTRRDRIAKEEAKQKAEEAKYTIDRLWEEYSMNRAPGKGLDTDRGRYLKYIQPVFGDKEPRDIIKLDVDRVRIKLSKKLSPQTVKHILNLFTWIINYGTKNNLCQGVSFHIQKPTVNNEKTEDLTPEQLERLLQAIEEDENIDVGRIMKIALFTGMRRGEIFNLKWKDTNLGTGFIFIRDPKGGVDQKIPINETARDILQSIHKTRSPYVFPGRDGGKRTTTGVAGRRIRERAGLPKSFRPLHGLRHVYASMLASSGKVDMYVLQKLMTHKSPKMTQRYAHLRDEALKNGAGQIDEIFNRQKDGEPERKIVQISGKR